MKTIFQISLIVADQLKNEKLSEKSATKGVQFQNESVQLEKQKHKVRLSSNGKISLYPSRSK